MLYECRPNVLSSHDEMQGARDGFIFKLGIKGLGYYEVHARLGSLLAVRKVLVF